MFVLPIQLRNRGGFLKIEKILKNSLMPEIKIWGMMLPKEVDESADHRNGTGNRMGEDCAAE